VGIPFPLDEVLYLTPTPKHAVIENSLDLVFFFSINQIRRWFDEVWPVSGGLAVWRQE